VILVVSALIATEESALLEDVIPARACPGPCSGKPESPFSLLDEISANELDCKTDEDCAESEELDSSTALLSPPSGPELLASSPQAIRPAHAKQANTTENFES
jgi:hypothetical protein